MISLLKNKQKADAIGLDLTMTRSRFEVLDFTPPFMEARLTVMTKEVQFVLSFTRMQLEKTLNI